MTPAEAYQKQQRFKIVLRKFNRAIIEASKKFDLNPDIGTPEAHHSHLALDDAMFKFVEGKATMPEVETAFKAYVKTIINPTTEA
jgi:hypothetical protein